MAVERWTPQRRRELTRSTLIAAATQVFGRRGFEGASLEEIADTAGFTRGAIYKNFGSKEELFLAVCDHDFTCTLESFSARLEHAGGGLPDIAGLAALWHETVVADTNKLALNMEFRLYAMRNPDVAARFAEHQHTTRAALAQFIADQAQQAGLRVTIAPLTLAGILDAASWGLVESIAVDPDDAHLLESFLELIMSTVCAEDCSAMSSPPTDRAHTDG